MSQVTVGECLHCCKPPVESGIQVSCDDCDSFVCNNCHWCHEFQANHEIRVCDRCDAFYCRSCDEMDQCEDCNEVVCGNCSTLMSCKFCGCGLCEDCATACGRCSIVLCARDAKFAVECDTCRMPYCLVCLASGTKEPCVRCGHRPSKRVEQLVHLRLKSIYKAFKQSGATLEGKNEREIMPKKEESTNDLSMNGDVGAVLQAAAAAAAHSNVSPQSDICKQKIMQCNHERIHDHDRQRLQDHRQLNHFAQERGHRRRSERESVTNENIFSRTQAEADAAAAALLAELEEEEKRPVEKSNKKKKKKKKSKPTKTSQNSASNKKNEKTHIQKAKPIPIPPSSPLSTASIVDDEIILTRHQARALTQNQNDDSVESQLAKLVSEADVEGIEKLLNTLRGVPGRAALRKNAKKAVKRLKEEIEQQNLLSTKLTIPPKVLYESCAISDTSSCHDNNSNLYKAPEPLLTLISSKMKMSQKYECIMHMAPSVVGWVIGKGGQRIRDLMVDSGAKVWIDQDSMGPKEARIVYVSGGKPNVDCAVRMIKDLVAKAPVGNGGPNNLGFSKESYKPNPHTQTPTEPRPILPPAQHESKTNRVSISPMEPIVQVQTKSLDMVKKYSNESETVLVPKTKPDLSFHVPLKEKSCKTVEEITCEIAFISRLIGRSGLTLKHIQGVTGAKIEINQSTSPCKIIISGNQQSVRTASETVRELLHHPQPQANCSQNHGNGRTELFVYPAIEVKDDIIDRRIQTDVHDNSSTYMFHSDRLSLEQAMQRQTLNNEPHSPGSPMTALQVLSSGQHETPSNYDRNPINTSLHRTPHSPYDSYTINESHKASNINQINHQFHQPLNMNGVSSKSHECSIHTYGESFDKSLNTLPIQDEHNNTVKDLTEHSSMDLGFKNCHSHNQKFQQRNQEATNFSFNSNTYEDPVYNKHQFSSDVHDSQRNVHGGLLLARDNANEWVTGSNNLDPVFPLKDYSNINDESLLGNPPKSGEGGLFGSLSFSQDVSHISRDPFSRDTTHAPPPVSNTTILPTQQCHQNDSAIIDMFASSSHVSGNNTFDGMSRSGDFLGWGGNGNGNGNNIPGWGNVIGRNHEIDLGNRLFSSNNHHHSSELWEGNLTMERKTQSRFIGNRYGSSAPQSR